MRVELIAPSRDEPVGIGGKSSLAPPLALAILAALTPPQVEVSLTDENVDPIDWAGHPDLVGVTCTTLTATRAYAIADRFRAAGIRVVLGGLHPSALPQEALAHADAVVVGEAETLWAQLLADAGADGLRPVYQAPEYPALAGLPFPRRDLFRRGKYLLPDTLFTTRGCPYGCSFCSVTTFFGGTYRSRPVEEVLAELGEMGSPRLLAFLDDNVAANPGRAKRLFRALAGRRLTWFGQADLNIARDEELLATAAASGCTGLLIGIESISQANLAAVGKRTNVAERYEAAIARIQAHGIAVHGAFLVGLDEDSEDAFAETLRFARRVRLESAQFNIPTPYPGTRLYAELEREGRIFDRDWSHYGSDRVVYTPRRLSVKRLQEGHDWLWREFYSLPCTWQRIGWSHPNWLLMWLINLNFRGSAGLLGPLSRLYDHLANRYGGV
ncbi:MAG: B12-binding domain-containing radical SAM protein [Chloroflexi bacterium]|nr:B12-binding domain-containing radical SAM protein [Chloroflexota bacterium]MCL5109016.1 B12-binding domain-containing radical SAM protein [Chloroflexota bacterium]